MDLHNGSLRQRRHYEYLQELQAFSTTLPMQIQQRLPLELLSNLANALLDNTVFDIVAGLQEIQSMTEESLSESRSKLVQQRRSERVEKLRKHREHLQNNQAAPHRLPLIQKENERELQEFDDATTATLTKVDKRILTELDQLVIQQQTTLEKAGVPGFYVTANSAEVQVQMYLLKFIIQLSSKRHQLL